MTELSFITLVCWIAVLALTWDSILTKPLILISLLYIPIVDGWEEDKILTHNKTITKQLVSSQPSHTQIEGSVSGSFLMFRGVIEESRVYLLREEVRKGLYKDFEVKHEVYIREDVNLLNKGKFVQYFKCYRITDYFDLFGHKLWSKVGHNCEYQKQEIVVPVGSVIKELNI
ncbi:hypothetical protein VPIG_00157 [Vibrio phage PWH3a-P1]|uniref:hypothetical protein n=1 Tax=Vibrio phage PWH3a-P1 TaxID=754058 RepID=UPI0002C0AE31|nr:hypothetical protein VPIG_00157 [Vibrio phage PWH3a-P1]AGH32014.1 hypothetical protein VPIG_00157 [Vibrio phage PWH3a-P1]